MSPAEAFTWAARYHDAGNFALAEQYARMVLSAEPSHAEAHHILGVIAWQRGDLAGAVAHLENSLKCNRGNAVTWQHLADVHDAAGNTAAAITHYEQSLRLRPDFAEGHNALGLALRKANLLAGAADCFRKAIRLKPTWAAAYNNLGNTLRVQGLRREALEALEQAFRLAPDSADIAINLGTFHHVDLDNVDQAAHYYRQTLALKPPYAAEVCNSLGCALKEQGLLAEAVAQFREALRLDPDHAMAKYNLSELAAAGHYVFAAAELENIKASMRSGRVSAADRVLYGFALGTVLDKQKAYDEAFDYFDEANKLQRRILQEAKVAFDARAHEAQVANIIAQYDSGYFERTRGWGTDSELPVFIVGMPRSGSTLVEQISASHPHVFGWGESGDMHRFQSGGAPASSVTVYESLVMQSAEAAHKLAADYLRRLAEVGPGAARVTNKTLENVGYLGLIATLFPRARIIHCRRNALDTCLSCYTKRFQALSFTWSLEDLGAYYRAYEKLMAHWSRVLPIPIHEVAYEELVADQERVSRQMIDYCGLDWDERCLDFHKTRRIVRTASAVQVRKPITGDAIGRWKNYRKHLGPLGFPMEE